jgi:hypothetical protein
MSIITEREFICSGNTFGGDGGHDGGSGCGVSINIFQKHVEYHANEVCYKLQVIKEIDTSHNG